MSSQYETGHDTHLSFIVFVIFMVLVLIIIFPTVIMMKIYDKCKEIVSGVP